MKKPMINSEEALKIQITLILGAHYGYAYTQNDYLATAEHIIWLIKNSYLNKEVC